MFYVDKMEHIHKNVILKKFWLFDVIIIRNAKLMQYVKVPEQNCFCRIKSGIIFKDVM